MKTQRVRIRCLIAPDGRWNAGGYGGAKDYQDSVCDWVFDGMPHDVPTDAIRAYWIEADVPVPEVETLEGKVVE